MIGKQTTLDLNGPILSFVQQPQSLSVCGGGIQISGNTTGISTSYNNLTVRGSLYYPTSNFIGSNVDVIVLYHPSIDSSGVTPSSSALNFLNIVTNTSQINIRDKIIFSVAYPQDAIPAWLSNSALISQEFPELLGNYGGSYANFVLGDNIQYVEAALLWVKNNLNSYLSTIGVSKTIDKIFTFGHSQGAYLAHILNTMHQVDGVISNAPGPIDLLTRCSTSESQGDNNISCLKIKTSLGSTSVSPQSYNNVSLSNFLSGTLSPALFTQALDDTTGNSVGTPQVANMQNIMQPGLESCVNCAAVEFRYYATGGHAAFVTNPQLQADIRQFFNSSFGSVTFVGIATAFFPTQDPPNPASNTGTLSYRWNAEGFGPLTDGTFQGATITGSGTTTLTITNATSPIANGLRLFVGVDYVPSAYSQPVGSAVTVGTGRSTGNAVNEILNSDTATLTVFPVLTVAQQPIEQTAAQTRSATFTTLGALTDTSQGDISYRWQLNGNDLNDSSTVIGSGSTSLSIALPNIGINTVRARLTHPTSCSSPVFTNTVNFNVVDARQIITFEQYDGSSARISNINLFDGEFTLLPANAAVLTGFYAPERDINVEMDIFAAAGRDNGGFRGGEGGFSRVRFRLPQNVEFLIAGFNFGETGYIYRRSSLMLIVGAGGWAGPGGNGGPGGGIGVAGGNGSGRGGGTGGAVIANGALGQNAFFGSSAASGASPRAPFPQGGRAVGCPPGNFWNQQGVSPCQNLGNTQFRLADGTIVRNSAVISRGFKAGRGVRQTAGAGDSGAIGGTGATGGNGGTGGGGAGGGSGYQDGSIQVIQTSLGGNTSTSARIIVRAIN